MAAIITVPADAVWLLLESSTKLLIPYQTPKIDKKDPRIRYSEAILKSLKK